MTDDLATAVAHHRAGRLDEAEKAYRQLLETYPEQPDLLHLLGGVTYQRGDPETALSYYDRSIAAAPKSAADTVFFNRGNALKALGRHDEAMLSFQAAVGKNPKNTSALYNLGLLLQNRGDTEAAEHAYREALKHDYGHAPSLNNLGALLHNQGRDAEAEEMLRQALVHAPGFPDAMYNLSNLLWHQRRLSEAAEMLEQCLAAAPDNAGLHVKVADCLMLQGRQEEAIHHYREAIRLDPGNTDAHNNLGVALSDLDRIEEAEQAFRKVTELDPSKAAAWQNLGVILQRTGHSAPALEAYQQALAHDPDNVEGRFGLCIAQIPVIPDSEQDVEASRARYEEHLTSLKTYFLHADREKRAAAARAVGSVQPFYLAYQGYNDRSLQALYGNLVCDLMTARYPAWSIAPRVSAPKPGEPLRVGLVSGFFRWHSVWTIPLRGWLTGLDRQKVSLYAYNTQGDPDEATRDAMALADRFIQGPKSLEDWAERIRQDALHVVIFPEIGMDPMSAKLAALRLAPVQCTTLGHPQTTGLRTIDYFLSADLMEPENAGDYYTERLVRLPDIGVYYEPACTEQAAVNRADFGLDDQAVLYWCCQSVYKYQPQYDDVFARIAKQVPNAVFLFLHAPYPAMTEKFQARLTAAFTKAGVDATKHVRFLDRLSVERFAALAEAADVGLDSIGWSGFNTTLETLHWGTPIVTLPIGPMRGRHTAGVLKAAGVTDTIADSVERYVDIAVTLGRDPAARKAVSERVLAARERIYRDERTLRGLEAFLVQAVADAGLS